MKANEEAKAWQGFQVGDRVRCWHGALKGGMTGSVEQVSWNRMRVLLDNGATKTFEHESDIGRYELRKVGPEEDW